MTIIRKIKHTTMPTCQIIPSNQQPYLTDRVGVCQLPHKLGSVFKVFETLSKPNSLRLFRVKWRVSALSWQQSLAILIAMPTHINGSALNHSPV